VIPPFPDARVGAGHRHRTSPPGTFELRRAFCYLVDISKTER
jgi:hypothetical protein